MKKGIKRAVVVLIVLIVIMAAVFLTVFVLAKQKKVFINKWFVNENAGIIGVDVSSYQADIDMYKLKDQNISFIFIKATEGSNTQDSRFAENWKNAKDADLLSGAYHFFSYDSEGRTQAENFINTVGPDINGRLLPVVDIEYYGDKEQNPPEKEDVIRELTTFLELVENEYGVKPLIYTRPDLYKKYLKGGFDGYPKWISSLYTPISWNYSDDWYIWQYLNRGELEGYTGGEKYIDLNILNKDKNIEDLIVDREQ
ncbi:MAG: glycoside hydrolase family 25 [Lachnospiraceae bacterium]|nr:glycoside hydrolase family 25 [Lachnospiraceae bacterium]